MPGFKSSGPRGLQLLPLRVPRLVLVVATLVTAAFATQAPFVRVDGSIESLLVEGDPERAYHEEIERTFGTDEITRIGLFGERIFTPEGLERIDRLSRRLERLDGVQDVMSLTTIRGVKRIDSGLRTGLLLHDLPESRDEALGFREDVLAESLYRGTVVAPDGRATAITVFYEPMTDREFEESGLEETVRREATRLLDGIGEIAIAGIPTYKVHGARRMEQDIRLFSALAMFVVVAVLLAAFRRPRDVAVALAPVITGVVWTNGLMAIVDHPITIGTLVLNPLLMAIGVAYAIHVVARYRLELAPRLTPAEAAEATLRHIGLPVGIAGVTTILGLVSLVPHPVPTIRDLGVWAVFGITVTTVTSVTVVPALLALLPEHGLRLSAVDRRLSGLLEIVAQTASGRRGRFVLLVGVVLCLVSVFGMNRIRVETDYPGFFDPDSTVRLDARTISDRLAGTQPLHVVLESDTPRTMTRTDVLRGIRRLEAFLEAHPRVDRAVSPLDHISVVREALLPGGGNELPRTQVEADQLLLLVHPDDSRRVISPDASRANLLVHTTLSASAEVEEFVTETKRHAERVLPGDVGIRVTGTVVLLNRTADVIAREQALGLARMLFVLAVLMTIVFRSIRIGLLSLVPNAFPILLLFGIMGWSGVSLNVSTSMIAVIALGIAVDDTVHYLTAFAKASRRLGDAGQAAREAIRTVGRPILFTSIALAGGFLVSTLSGFEPVRHFGALAAVTMLVALFTDLLLTPAIALRARLAAAPLPARNPEAPVGSKSVSPGGFHA